MAKILRINMTELTSSIEEVPESYRKFGGRGLTSCIVGNEVPPTCDPLSEDNKLVFAPGILGGTSVPCSGRLSVGTKSPLTKGIKEANTGGAMGQNLAKLGFKAVVFEGKAKEPSLLMIDKNGVRFSSASSLAGIGSYQILEKIRQQYGDSVTAAFTGPAGDMMLEASAIVFTTPDFHLRVAARGGVGAVMGSKNLKAVIVDSGDENLVEIQDTDKLKENVKALTKGVLSNPFVGGLRKLGTPQIVMITQTAGALPTKNFSAGQFKDAEKISGEHMEELLKNRPNGEPVHRCMEGCIISCSNVYTDDAGELIVSGIEYETIALIGSNCLIGDLDMVARINRACNDVGVDTMDIGGALAVAMEGGLLEWGDAEGALKLVEEIAQGTENGRIIGGGVKIAGEKLGVRRVPHVKGQCLSGYDPRILKGTGVTFATSPQGADHTAGIVLPGPHDPNYNPVSSTGQAEKSQFMQSWMAAVDTLGLCMMLGMPVMEAGPGLDQNLIGCVSAVTGESMGENYLMELGGSVLEIERRFNKAAGLTAKDDRLPKFFSEESHAPGAPVFDVSEEEIDRVHKV
ncbi:MAG: aldehyde ferredoxin oxidoreductase C-terminal domain-containing protein [Acidobacteriota bacterium]